VRPIGISRDGVWTFLGDSFARLAAGERPARGAHPFLPFERGAEQVPLPDVFFVAIHGAGGEDGTLQGYLELLHRPYTGAGVLALAAGMDKWIAKRLWESEGLPVVPWVGVTEERWAGERAAMLEASLRLGLPLFVKPANLGSSVGISKAKDRTGLARALDEAARYDRKLIVEQGIDAREIEVSVLGNDDPVTSVPGEIVPCREFYDYAAKYVEPDSELLIPAPLTPEQTMAVQQLAIQAFLAIDGAGMARVDFLLDRQSGEIFLNEINTIPGFTSISMYPKLWEASGLSFSSLVDRLVELALERHEDKSRSETSYRPEA